MTRISGLALVPFLAGALAGAPAGAAPAGAGERDLRLIDAVRKADTAADKAAVRVLVNERRKRGVDVDARDGSGATALHWAVYKDDRDTVDLLLRAGANANLANDLEVTPLRLACTNSNTALIARLLEAGADPNIAPATDGTPLMIAARRGNAMAVKLLLARGAAVNAAEALRGQTALMWAVARRHADVVRALLEGGADVHARSKTVRRFVLLCCQEYQSEPDGGADTEEGGYTPLLFAAREGDIEAARHLLAAGANIEDATPAGASALVIAAHSNQGAFAAFLLEHGADVNAAGAGYTALHAAVLRRNPDLAKTLLARGANPNARQTKASPSRHWATFAFDKNMIGATPFLLAMRMGQLDMMRLLAAGGADVNLPLDDGKTPVMAAVWRIRTLGVVEHQARASRSIELAMELGSMITGADHQGDTALHLAAARRLDAAIQLLVDRGAPINARNNSGKTPLGAALAPIPPPKNAGEEVRDEYTDLLDRTAATTALLRKLGATE